MSRLFEVFHGGEVSRYHENDLPLWIGSGSDDHLQLDGVTEEVGCLGLADGHLFFQPSLTGTVCLHNGAHITQSVWVKGSDQIRIGEHLLEFHVQRDLVEIDVLPLGLQSRHTAGKSQERKENQGGLPRMSPPLKRRRGSRLLVGTGLFLAVVLTAITLFLVRGNVFTLDIEPVPETVKVSGVPPVVQLQGRYFAWPGQYALTASLEGYADLHQEITIAAGSQASFQFTLEKLPGSINVETVPFEGVQITIDGKYVGTGPLQAFSIGAGKHTINLHKQRYQELVESIDVEGMGRMQTFRFQLQPGWGTVEVITIPESVEVKNGTTLLGSTPGAVDVPAGEHTLTFVQSGYLPLQRQVTVSGGEITVLEPVILQHEPAVIDLSSSPSGSSVTVDGVYRGQTPLQVEVAAGTEHTFVLISPGYKQAKYQLVLEAGEEKQLHVPLEAETGVVFVEVVPADARLSINGGVAGAKSVGRFVLPAEKQHRFVFTRKGYQDKQVKVIPRSSYSQQIRVTMEPLASLQSGKPVARKKAGLKPLFQAPVEFQMGASRREPGRRANEQLRKVRLVRPVYVGAREVTNGEYRRFRPQHRSGSFTHYSLDKDNQPVVNVSWEEAALYCNWLSRQEGIKPFYVQKNGRLVADNGTGYRLPSEAEWAYGARLSGRRQLDRYPWNGSFPPQVVVGNFADKSMLGVLNFTLADYDDGHPVTAPVGSFKADPGGFFDFGGNVAEWCHDFYSAVSGSLQTVEQDPMGPVRGTHRVVRGSSWRDGSVVELRFSYRSYGKGKEDDIGFRVARYLQ